MGQLRECQHRPRKVKARGRGFVVEKLGAQLQLEAGARMGCHYGLTYED